MLLVIIVIVKESLDWPYQRIPPANEEQTRRSAVKMGDDGFDPCECTWSHEMAMRRLLSILRQTQTYCTDTECFEGLPSVPRGDTLVDGGGSNFILVAVCWLILAFALIFMRPRSLSGQLEKPQDGGQEPRREPPAPPAPPTY
ncbi:hypothetical protein J437_LFUL001468 [Ladona fulva]|uniref:Small integral membrane protein 14 n=1 Tax=Ladona fulva TaxID=123851 RepID=A0A8K0JUR9_LADFU|nr:hypothetical protein J437_LFUL001468 [Ladona fulva]